MPTPTIRLDAVSKNFLSKSGEEVKALEGISFDVARSEFVSIIGPSGCDKSTVLSLIAGLEKPTGGRVYLDGETILTYGELDSETSDFSYLLESLDVRKGDQVAFFLPNSWSARPARRTARPSV